jgi:hypothetical protein
MMMRLLGVLGCAVAAASPAPTMLNVEWSFGAPDIPHGTQCSLSGVLGDSWILALGNRANPDWSKTGGKGPAGGCWTGGYSLPTGATAAVRNWTGLPECPSCVKDIHCHLDFPHWPSCTPGGQTECCTGQCGNFVSGGSSAQTVQLPATLGGGEALVMAGGFSHVESTAACYMLRQDGGGFNWTALPSLPYPIQTGGLAQSGTKLIIVGGGNGAKGGTVWSDVNGTAFGRRVWILDLAALADGWVAGPDLPGSPREMPTVVAINGSVFVLGGLAGAKNPPTKPPVNCSLGPGSPGVTIDNCGANVQDNWRLDSSMKWSPLPSNNLTVPGAMPNSVVVANRYILTIGYDRSDGAGAITHPSTTLSPNFGSGNQINASCLKTPPPAQPDPNPYSNGVTVFDAVTGTFGAIRSTAASGSGLTIPEGCPQEVGIPFNCFMPNIALSTEGELWMVGGECSPFILNGKDYWHYPTLVMRGKLTVA